MAETPEAAPSAPAPVADDLKLAELFRVPPEEFVSRRDQLVRELRQAGNKAAAGEVKALRRPKVAAWAVNQLAERHPEKLSELVALGERLRTAHEALLAGGGTAPIREITAEQRRLVAELTDIAVGLLGRGGEAQRDAISHTLGAAVADRHQGELVRSGRLTSELAAPSGFGGLDLLFGAATTSPRHDPPTTSAETDDHAEVEEERGERERAEKERSEREQAERHRQELERREREARLERLRREAARREAEAASAAQVVEALRQELDGLRARLAAAERRATAAADAATAARAELEQAAVG